MPGRAAMPSRRALLALQVGVFLLFLLWHVLTATGVLDPFFFGRRWPRAGAGLAEFATGVVFKDLAVTLTETVLAFAIGTVGGIVFVLVRAGTLVAAVFDPYVKMLNALPRVVLAPIFALWLSLDLVQGGLGVTLVFFIVFFNVYQGLKEVSPVVLANARMLGMSERQLLRHVYLPSALSWVFSSLHTAVGRARRAVGEHGASAGLGYRIAQAEGVFDTVGVFAGMFILAAFVIVIDAGVSAVERRLLHWRPTVQSQQQA